jgi:phage/plasmid-associated DNA primase
MTRPKVSEGVLGEYRRENDPVRRFLLEEFGAGKGPPIPTAFIHGMHRIWAEREHEDADITVQALGKKIGATFKDATSVDAVSPFFGGAKIKHWSGIVPKDPSLAKETNERLKAEKERKKQGSRS